MNKYNRLLILIIVILVVFNGFFVYEYFKNKQSNNTTINNVEVNGISTDLTRVVEENKSSIVTVINNTNIGSGFIYKKGDNCFYVLTAFHVLDEGNNFVVLASGAKLNASIKGYDAMLDLAVLKVECDLEVKPIKTGNSSIVKDGEFIISIGTPSNLDYAGSVELGIVSKSNISLLNSIKFNKQDISYYGNYIQLSGNLTNGYSGSPIININSEVIGMCLMEDGGNVFCSPINEIKIVADKIIKDEEYTKLNLGIKGKFISNMENYEKASLNIPLDVVSGIYIEDVLSDTLGSIMGIKVNDIIKSINDKTIDSFDSLLEIEYSSNSDIKLVVIRNNEEIELNSTVHD